MTLFSLISFLEGNSRRVDFYISFIHALIDLSEKKTSAFFFPESQFSLRLKFPENKFKPFT